MESEKVKEIKEKLKERYYYLDQAYSDHLAYGGKADEQQEEEIYFLGDIRTLINELESENERLRVVVDIANEMAYRKKFIDEWRKEYQKELDKQGNGHIAGYPNFDLVYKLYFEQKDRIAELEGEITKLDMINSKLEVDIELLNKQNIDLEIDRDYYQEQFNEQEDFYIEWNKQQLKQFAERLKENFAYDIERCKGRRNLKGVFMIPISKDIILPVPKSNIQFVNSVEEFEKIELVPSETILKFDNNQPCFYVRERDKFGEYLPTKIYFYENFAQKVQNLEREEFIKKCREVGLDDLKTELACMFFLENKKPLEVWEWSLKNTTKDWEWEYVRSLKCKLKKKLFTKVI